MGHWPIESSNLSLSAPIYTEIRAPITLTHWFALHTLRSTTTTSSKIKLA